jgi:hypothetical protein
MKMNYNYTNLGNLMVSKKEKRLDTESYFVIPKQQKLIFSVRNQDSGYFTWGRDGRVVTRRHHLRFW